VSVCGTVVQLVNARSFSWEALHDNPFSEEKVLRASRWSLLKAACRICLAHTSQSTDANPIRRYRLCLPSLHRPTAGQGILTLCPSPPAFAIGLGPTNPWLITIAKETLIFRRAGISPALRLLVPAFSLPYAPLWLAPLASLQMECSLTTCRTRRCDTSSVSVLHLNPDYLWRGISR
jgi:hypothetical protein